MELSDLPSKIPKYILILSTLLALLILTFPIYKLILMSALLSYTVYPTKRLFKKFLKSENLAALVCTLFWIFIALYVVLFLMNFILIGLWELNKIVSSAEFQAFTDSLKNILESNLIGRTVIEQLDVKTLVRLITNFVSQLLIIAPNLIIQLIAVLFFSFYMIRDGDDFFNYLIKKLDLTKKHIESLKMLDVMFKNIIYGYLLTAVIIGVIILGTFLILGVPQPFLLSVVAIILSIIPLAGQVIIMGIAIIHALITGQYVKVIILSAILILLSFVDNIIRPLVAEHYGVSGKRGIKIHPLLFLFGLISGPLIFGPMGLLIGPMIFGIISLILRDL